MDSIIYNYLKSDLAYREEIEKPSLLGIRNIDIAVEMVYSHIKKLSNIIIISDVDMDGIGSTKIMNMFLKTEEGLLKNKIINAISKVKEHGINQKMVDYINSTGKFGLCITLDSSTNMVDMIKQLNCDVLVIDHHEPNHEHSVGATNKGSYIIVNNMYSNNNLDRLNKKLLPSDKVEEYRVDSRVSCGLLVYEFIRIYCSIYRDCRIGSVLEYIRLYDWAVITLFSDMVFLHNERNQYYVNKTINSSSCEKSLKVIVDKLNSYEGRVTKSFIIYKLVPLVNSAIRAGNGAETLDIIINKCDEIDKLEKYRELQNEKVSEVLGTVDILEGKKYAMVDVSKKVENDNYNGLIASRISNEKSKITVVYRVNSGIAKGSFRGHVNEMRYKDKFLNESGDISVRAEGHQGAFGFEVVESELRQLLERVARCEEGIEDNNFITVGESLEIKGREHIEDLDTFKRKGELWNLAIANSRLSSLEQVSIVGDRSSLEYIEQRGKVYRYKYCGVNAIAMEMIVTDLVEMYVEIGTSFKAYLRNFSRSS